MPEVNPFENPHMQQYFLSLPQWTKESILQSGIKFSSLEELQQFVGHLNR